MSRFTVEEMNLMCIFNLESRETAIRELEEFLLGAEDPELKEIAANAVRKLKKVTDEEFGGIALYPA
jgi:hypothetical protein